MRSATLDVLCDRLLRCGKPLTVITGAGCSTESGIPDYRSPSGVYRSPNFKPLTWQRFRDNEFERRRYWSRSLLGYTRMGNATANVGHMALQALADAGWVRTIVTQNVDGLHHLAANGGQLPNHFDEDTCVYLQSASPLIELHGNIHMTRCVACGAKVPRRVFQRLLQENNESLVAALLGGPNSAVSSGKFRADGDFALADEMIGEIQLPPCSECGGYMRPDVVLFGENVATPTVSRAEEAIDAAKCVLCCGTSLQVYSAFRFVERAKKKGTAIFIVNHGATRGDAICDGKIETSSIATFLQDLHDRLKSGA